MAKLDYIHEPIQKLAVPLQDLKPYARNARRGDLGAIIDSLETHGQYKTITVRAKTNEVLAGNHTLAAAKEIGWDQIAVTFVDVDDDTAARIVLVDNRTSDLGTYDDDALVGLLQGLQETEEELEGTGYSDDDLAALLEQMDDIPDPLDEEGTGTEDKGAGIEAWGVTYGEPDITPERGSVWRLGDHVLVVADTHKDWELWVKFLEPGALFWPYPSLLAPFTNRAKETPIVMVQHDPFMAGWVLTKWNRLREQQAAQVQVEAGGEK